MEKESVTRHSPSLPPLRFSLSLLYVGRLLLGMKADTSPPPEEVVEEIDAQIESVTDELVATELLHEAAQLAGDCQP